MTDDRRAANEPEERPGWLYPLILLAITAAIGAVILYLYVGPGLDELTGAAVRPTSEQAPIAVTLGTRRFAIPGNYIRLPAQRRAGAASEIELEAFLPDMHGYSEADAEGQRDVSCHSTVVALILKAGAPDLSERERFERIYQRNADPLKPPYEYFGLTVFQMAETSGYAAQHVFTRELDGGEFAVVICSPDDKDHDIGGLCMREMAWGEGLTAIYSFRGGRLRDWKEIDDAVKELLARLEAPPG